MEKNIRNSIIKLEDILNETSQKVDSSDDDDKISNQIKGKRKSGRGWKEPKKRASSIIKTRGILITKKLDKRRELKLNLQKNKQLSKSIKDERIQQKLEKKQRREENLKRQEENRKKSEVVQVIKNTSKIKKMKKKHLRTIEKRDTTNL